MTIISSPDDKTGPNSPGGDDVLSFSELLDVLGFTDGEFVSICHKENGSPLRATIRKAGDGPVTVAALPAEADIYFGVNPVLRKINGRGKNEDATRLSSLYLGLDFSEGKCGDIDPAHAIIDDLSKILGTRLSAITHSGGGFHPYWPIADDPDPDLVDSINAPDLPDETTLDPAALLKRWKRLVNAVAEKHGAKVDPVFDLARILRVPETFNNKAATNGHGPIPVVCHRGSGVALTLLEIHRRFDDYGIHHIPDYPDPDAKRGERGHAKVVSDPDGWTFADTTCNYVAAMIRGWGDPNTVEIGKGRHPWLLSQAIRLACAYMLGCITKADYQHAKDVLTQTFTYLLADGKPFRHVGDGEIADIFDYGIDKAATKTPDEARGELGGHKHESEIDEEAFWNARTILADLRQFARARRVGPWGMLGNVLTLVVSAIPPNVVLPPEVGDVASLNLFVVLVGESGRTKSTSMAAAQAWLTVDPQPKPTKPATGEGLANLFADVRKTNGVATQIGLEWSVLARIPEVETLTKTGARSGSTIMSELRSGFSGERLGHDYRSANRITVCDHRYRLAMTVGVQPHLAKPLLDDVGAGTPQRFVWLPVNDPGAPRKRPKPSGCKKLNAWPNHAAKAGGSGKVTMVIDPNMARTSSLDIPVDPAEFDVLRIPEAAQKTIDDQAFMTLSDGMKINPLDSHRLLCQLKVAAALMALDGRYREITDEDWQLAETVMEKSTQTRDLIQSKISEKTEISNLARGEAEGKRAYVAEETQFDLAVKRVANKILEYLTDEETEELPRAVLRKKFHSRYRDHFDDAETLLLQAGRIEKIPADNAGPDGFVLRLTG